MLKLMYCINCKDWKLQSHFGFVVDYYKHTLKRKRINKLIGRQHDIMGKLQSTKVIRVWVLGASICATIFVAFSLAYNFWGIKTVIDGSTNAEKTTYFGLWNKCVDERKGNLQGEPLKPMVSKCEAYGDGNLAGFNKAPGL